MELSKVEIILMQRALKATDGIFVGGITSQLGISVRDAADAFRSLRTQGFLEFDNSVLRLTPEGRKWIFENQKLFVFSGQKTWREVPEEFKSNVIRPFEPYAPRLSKIPKGALKSGLSRKT